MTIYLYIKEHAITGLKYFGMTRKKNPFKYNGSGIYWNKHLNKHGKSHVKTIDVFGFDHQEEATHFAISFSNMNNIVESTLWANLRIEEALDGNPKGLKQSKEWIENNAKARLGKSRPKQSELMLGNSYASGKRSLEHSKYRSEFQTGKKRGKYKKHS